MPDISITEDVSKFDISISSKSPQPLNIFFILITDEVSKLDKSMDSNSSHFSNIPSILVTIAVFNPFILTSSKSLQL